MPLKRRPFSAFLSISFHQTTETFLIPFPALRRAGPDIIPMPGRR
jgi:hypothetical protein